MREIGDTRFFTVHEVAEVFKVSDKTIINYIRNGKIHGNKIGRQYFVTETALSDYLNNTESEKVFINSVQLTREELMSLGVINELIK